MEDRIFSDQKSVVFSLAVRSQQWPSGRRPAEICAKRGHPDNGQQLGRGRGARMVSLVAWSYAAESAGIRTLSPARSSSDHRRSRLAPQESYLESGHRQYHSRRLLWTRSRSRSRSTQCSRHTENKNKSSPPCARGLPEQPQPADAFHRRSVRMDRQSADRFAARDRSSSAHPTTS